MEDSYTISRTFVLGLETEGGTGLACRIANGVITKLNDLYHRS